MLMATKDTTKNFIILKERTTLGRQEVEKGVKIPQREALIIVGFLS